MITHQQARQEQLNGATMVDVRESDEWEAGHVAGALLCPVAQIASDPDLRIEPDAPVITYCKAGGRAERAAEILEAAGYTDVKPMAGGFGDWQAAGYPTES